jgi:hypothetical protein
MLRHHALHYLSRKQPLAKELPMSGGRFRSFLCVYPLDLEVLDNRRAVQRDGVERVPRTGLAYRLKSFLIPSELVGIDYSPYDGETRNLKLNSFLSLQDLEDHLSANFGVKLEDLELDYKTDYPL